MNRNTLYIRVLLVLIALVVLMAFFNRSPHRSAATSWVPSSFNPVGAGHLAFYQTLADLHWPVERWREPLARLSTQGTGNTLIITRSDSGVRGDFSGQEIELLSQWVSEGNTLVLLGSFGEWNDTRDLLRRFGFTIGESQNPNPLASILHPLEPERNKAVDIPPRPGQTGTLVEPADPALPTAYPAGTELLRQSGGQPYLLRIPYGQGTVICGASAHLLDDTYLSMGDNLAIVLGLLAPDGRVPKHLFFEESHHGYSAVFAVAHLLQNRGIQLAGMLAVLGLLAFLSGSLLRFGPVLPLQRASGRSTLEFVDSVADLYRRADLRNDTLAYLFRETHQRVLARLNLPATASHTLIATRLKDAYPQLPSWKKLAQRFDSTEHPPTYGLPPSGWMGLARDLIEIKSAMA